MPDLLIYAVGYEERSSFAVQETRADCRIGLVFESHKVHAFERNLAEAVKRGDTLVSASLDESGFESTFSIELRRAQGEGDGSARVAVDVSSMTTSLMARTLKALFQKMPGISLEILYSPGAYQSPPDDPGRFVRFEPVPACEGWTQYPERPLSVVLGLGYEADQAIGTIEYLDPSGMWAFVPNGLDPRFRRDVHHANRALWSILERSHQLEYRVTNPHRLYTELRGLVDALARRSRVIIVPGGPKLFSALSITIQAEVGGEVSVWRASSHDYKQIRDVAPQGTIVSFSYPKFRKTLQNHEPESALAV